MMKSPFCQNLNFGCRLQIIIIIDSICDVKLLFIYGFSLYLAMKLMIDKKYMWLNANWVCVLKYYTIKNDKIIEGEILYM